MNQSFFASIFTKVGEVIEAAETPFAKMAIFLLPVLSPIVPATFTGLHTYKLLVTVFPTIEVTLLGTLSLIVGLVLEMLGYVGAIEFIHSLFRLIRSKENRYWLTVGLTGMAYLFYLLTMMLINVKLGEYFHTPPIINTIVGLLSFITVPTGLLAANYLGGKSEDNLDTILRQERREDRLKSKALKAGINVFQNSSETNMKVPNQFRNSGRTSRTTSETMGRPSIHQSKVFELLEHTYKTSGTVLGFKEVQSQLGLPQSTASRLRNKWIETHPELM